MSEFLKKFKSVFIVEDETTKAAPPADKAPQAPADAPPPPVVRAAADGAVSDKFMEILLSALEKNNAPGFDYLEFRQALKNLAKMPMDEATRFQSAYAMAQTMGVTPAALVESARNYLGVLSQEETRFNEAHAQQRNKLIGNREEEIRNLDAMIEQKTEQIRQLTLQIEEHRQRGAVIRKEIDDSTVKIENTKADFDATFGVVAGQIETDIAKIQEHLK